MANSPILDIPLLSASQVAKEATINSAISYLEKASNDNQVLTFSAGNVVLPLIDLQRHFLFKCTNVIAPRILTVPSATRIFAVDNTAGANPVTVTRGANSVVVANGEAGVIYVETTNIMFLYYSANGGTVNFTALGDTPNDYVGDALKFVRVNAAGTALEFVAAGAGITSFTDLDDVPIDYVGDALKAVRVNAAETALEFFALSVVEDFTNLGDVPATYVGSALKYVRVNAAETALEFVVAGDQISAFIDLEDVPVDYALAAGKLVVVNGTADGLEFVDPAVVGGGAASFPELSDTPNDYVGVAGYYVRVNAAANGLEFALPGDMITAFVNLEDVPNSYVGFGGAFVRINGAETGVEFDIATLGDFDVDYTVPPVHGQTLTFDGDINLWVPDTNSATVVTLDAVGDVDLSVGLVDGAPLTWDATVSEWVPGDPIVPLLIETKTASYTLELNDLGTYIRMLVATAHNLTVPTNASVAFPIGTQIPFRCVGAGLTTVVAAVGVTINTPETLVARKQGSSLMLVKVATDEWDLTGDLELV